MAQGCSGHPHRHWLLFPGAPVHTAPASTASAVVSPEVWPVIYRKNNGKYIITLVYDGLWGIKLLGYMMIYNIYIYGIYQRVFSKTRYISTGWGPQSTAFSCLISGLSMVYGLSKVDITNINELVNGC